MKVKMLESSTVQVFLRAFAVWIVIIVVESVHGTFRQLVVAPVIGDFTARRLAFFTGIALIFAIAVLFIRWIGTNEPKMLVLIGVVWAFLTILFEFVLGMFVLGYAWERMLEDYDLSRGGLMGIGIILLVFIPFASAKARSFISAGQGGEP